MFIPNAKQSRAAKTLNNAWMHLFQYGFKDVPVNVARGLIMDAERRVKSGFGPVPAQDASNLLECERKYLNLADLREASAVARTPDF